MINICGFFCVIMSCRDCIHALGSVTRSSQVYQHCPFCCFSRWTFPNRNQGWTTEFEACCIKTVNFTVYTVLLPENGKIHIFNHILHIYRFKFVKKKIKKKIKNAYLMVFWGPSMAVVSEWLAAVRLGRAQNLADKVHHLQVETTFQKWKLFKTKPKRKFFFFF